MSEKTGASIVTGQNFFIYLSSPIEIERLITESMENTE